MSELFLSFVNRGISASLCVLVVLVLRLCFMKKGPRWIAPILWFCVALRLILPFSIDIEGGLHHNVLDPSILLDPTPSIQIPLLNQSIPLPAPNPGDSANPMQIYIPLAAVLWLIGVAAFLLYALVSFLLLRRRLKDAVLLRDNLYQSEAAVTPFVMGFVRPRIYLPFSLKEEDAVHVIAHEKTHLTRRDNWAKVIGYVLLSLYWFHPLLWLAYHLFCRDIEFACDEQVIRNHSPEERARYSEALLSCSIPHRRTAFLCPLAFGEVSVKERIKSILSYKRPTVWLIVLAGIVAGAAAVAFLTSSKEPEVNGDYSSRFPSFDATVLEINDISILVAPDADTVEARSADRIVVSLENIPAASVPAFSVGESIHIVYDGLIQEIYPAVIPNVYAIYTSGRVNSD